MSRSKTQKTRFLVISDTHSTKESNHLWPATSTDVPFRQPLPRADVVLHCGDLTMYGHPEENARTLQLMAGIQAELKLMIAGNHDLSLDEDFQTGRRGTRPVLVYSESERRQVHDLWKGKAAKDAGVTYLEEGTHSFKLRSGAKFTVYASAYQPEFFGWAFPYNHDEDRFNEPANALADAKPIAEHPITAPVDIVMTHGPSYRIRDHVLRGGHVGCIHLLRALMRTRPLMHCCGHIHEGWGAERINWTDDAAHIAVQKGASIDWKETSGPRSYARGIERVDPIPGASDDADVKQNMAAYVDASSSGPYPLTQGQSTLAVNASIMNLSYRPVQAPWLIDLDLPLSD